MKVLVCGDRHWKNEKIIERELKKLPPDTTIIHGAAKGADNIAGNTALRLGLRVEAFPAEWKKYGRSAGPIRNRKMLDQNPDLVLAFHEDLSSSKGTKHMVQIAREKGVPVKLFTGKLEVYTAQYRYSGPNRLDITVKTGNPVFAPTWDMVKAFKAGALSEEKYTGQYIQLMRDSYRENKKEWLDLLDRERVVLVCFCKSGEFCHRILLANILTKLGAKYCGEIFN